MQKKLLVLALSMTALFGLARNAQASTMETSDLYISSTIAGGNASTIYNVGIATAGKQGMVLYKIIVSSFASVTPGAIEVFDNMSSTATRRVAYITGGAVKEYEFNVKLSSGLSYNLIGTGPWVELLYKYGITGGGYMQDGQWGPYQSSVTATSDYLMSLPGGGPNSKQQFDLYKIIVGSASTSASSIEMFNNAAVSTTTLVGVSSSTFIAHLDGTQLQDTKWNVHCSSGLNYTVNGSAPAVYNILYRVK